MDEPKPCPFRDPETKTHTDPVSEPSTEGKHHSPLKVTDVLDGIRLSPNHLYHPCCVVVHGEPVGPSLRHTDSWCSDLTPSLPGDRAAHPHTRNCECG